MRREIAVFGALVPSLLLYFLASLPLFLVFDRLLSRIGFYHSVLHAPLAKFGLFLCLFSCLVLLTGS